MSASKSETGKRRDEETAGRDNEAVAHPSASRHGPDVSSLPRSETYDLRPATRDPRPAAIALGANLGDRIGQLRAAVVALGAHPDVTVTARSPVYESEAHTLDGTAQPAYLNAVLTVATTLAPEALLDVLLATEREAGRTRQHRWASRTLDLDLALYDDLHLDTARLTVPHPRLAERRFVLQPLADLAPDRVVPCWNATVAALLAVCPDHAALHRTDLVL